MCDYIKSIPREIVLFIFGLLRSKDRSVVCSVSKLFKKLTLSSSKSLSSFPELYSSGRRRRLHPKSSKNISITNRTLRYIILKGDYHLIVRLKNIEFSDIFCFQIYEICKFGHLDIVKLFIEHGGDIVDETDWDEGLKGACIGDHLEIAKIMIEKGQYYWLDGGFKSACKYGRLEILRIILSSWQPRPQTLSNGMFYACSRNHSEVVKLIASEILRCKDKKQTGHFCAHCGKSVTEHM